MCNLIPDAIGSRTSFVLSFITQSSISLFAVPVHLAMLFFSFHLPTLIHFFSREGEGEIQMHSLCVVSPIYEPAVLLGGHFFFSHWLVSFLTLVTDASTAVSSASHCSARLHFHSHLFSGQLNLGVRLITSFHSWVAAATVDHCNCTCNCLKVQLTAFRPARTEQAACSHRKERERERGRKKKKSTQ